MMRRLYDSHAGIANGKRDACEPQISPSLALRLDYPQGTGDALLGRNNEANRMAVTLIVLIIAVEAA